MPRECCLTAGFRAIPTVHPPPFDGWGKELSIRSWVLGACFRLVLASQVSRLLPFSPTHSR